MKIRRATIDDLDQIRNLFYDTVTTINSKDYYQTQITTWASANENIDKWKEAIDTQYFLVAEIDNKIVGFASLTNNGLIDYLFTHKDFQRQGIASALLKVIEQQAFKLSFKEITADVSITARPFFEKQGFVVSKVYIKKYKEVEFMNSLMVKHLPKIIA